MKSNLLSKIALLSTMALFIVVVFMFQSCKEENQPPVVQITTPLQGEVIAIGDEVTISADADDPEDNIKEVRFYVNNVGIGSATAFPYTTAWSTEDKDAGSFTIKATVEDDDGEEAFDEVIVTLEQVVFAPEAAFSATPTQGEAPLQVSFTDESTNEPSTWNWEFGDGSTSTDQNPSHVYNVAGEYTVSLTVSNEAGTNTDTRGSFVNVTSGGSSGSAPVAAFSATPVSGDAPMEVIFSDESVNTPTSWLWNFGDGNTSTDQNPAHTYEVAGIYSVSLTVVNTNGNDTEIKENYINVNGEVEVPVASFTASPTAGTPGTEVTFTDLSENNPTSWLWDFGDGSTSTLQNPTRSYEEYGKYTVSLTVSNAAGTDTEILEELITITETPVASFSASPTTGNIPLKVHFQDESEWAEEWLWDFGDGTTSDEQHPVHIYEEEGVYDVSLIVENILNSNTEVKISFINVVDPCPPVTDIDGNMYATTMIGEQCWMADNLKVTHYPNGDVIPHVTDDNAWYNLDDNNTDDAYCFYDNNTNSEYGALYSYAAAIADDWQRDNSNGQGICPEGWHLPTDEEWTTLENWLSANGHSGAEGIALKSTSGWAENGNGTDDYGFNALPGGCRYYYGSFYYSGQDGYWWSATEYDSYNAWYRYLYYSRAYVSRNYNHKASGYSVRCTRDY